MQSLRELYKVGRGPSSSHTMGPERAANIMKERFPEADFFKVVLYGSLALTGEGHGTDRVVRETFAPVKCEVEIDASAPCPVHPNTMEIEGFRRGISLGKKRIYSVGGGTVVFEGEQTELYEKDRKSVV